MTVEEVVLYVLLVVGAPAFVGWAVAQVYDTLAAQIPLKTCKRCLFRHREVRCSACGLEVAR